MSRLQTCVSVINGTHFSICFVVQFYLTTSDTLDIAELCNRPSRDTSVADSSSECLKSNHVTKMEHLNICCRRIFLSQFLQNHATSWLPPPDYGSLRVEKQTNDVQLKPLYSTANSLSVPHNSQTFNYCTFVNKQFIQCLSSSSSARDIFDLLEVS